MTKKILFCTGIFPPQIGGPATYVHKLAQQFVKDSIPAQIITYSQKANEDSFGLDVVRIPWRFFLWTYFHYFLTVCTAGRAADVLYLQGSFVEGVPTVLANFFLRKPLVIRIGGIFSWEYATNKGWTNDLPETFIRSKQPWKSELFKTIDRWVISHCDRVIANSEYIKKLLIANGIQEKKISVVYNAFDVVTFPTRSRAALLNHFQLPDKKIVLSHGRFVPWKNFKRVVKYSLRLPNEYILVIAGDGPERAELLALQNQHPDKIRILGQQSKENIFYLNSLCHVFVLLSSYEGLSNALVEVMQQGKPIITSDIHPNREAVRGYEAAHVIPFDEAAYVKAVKSFEGRSEKKYQADLNRFSFDTIYHQTVALLCEW